MIELPQFAPDLAYKVFDNRPITDTVENLFPHATGYQSVPSFEKISTESLDSRIIGSISFTRANDNNEVYNLVGTTTHIYRYGRYLDKFGNAVIGFYDVSRQGRYEIADGTDWSFAVFGEYIIAVNKNYPMQILDMSDPNNIFEDFEDAPRAHKVKVWGNYVALIDVLDEKSHNRDMIAWSGLNNIKDWNFGDRASDADKQRLYDGGKVINATSSENPYIFLRNKIYRATFNPSSSLVFTIASVNFDGGIARGNSLVEANNFVFFYGDQGFYRISPDGSITNIGQDRVNNWVYSLIKDKDVINVEGYNSSDSTRVYWAIKDDYDYKRFNLILVYDYMLDRWSYIKTNYKHLINYTSYRYGLDDLDFVNNLDSLPASLDSAIWQRDSRILGIIDENGYLCTMTGKAMDATIISNVISDGQNKPCLLKDIMISTNLGSCGVIVYHTNNFYNNFIEEPERPYGYLMNSLIGARRNRLFKVKFNLYSNNKVDKFFINGYNYKLEPSGVM